MPVKTAFDMDGKQLFDYCQRNDLLRNPEISEIFGLEIPAKRTLGEKPENLAGSNAGPRSMHDSQESAPDTLAENSESMLNVSNPEVASGKDRLVSHEYKPVPSKSTGTLYKFYT
jgi:hypothetical protein